MLPEAPHALAVAELLERLRVCGTEGLSEAEARARRQHFGANTIASRRPASVLRILAHQLGSPVVYLLSGAAGLAFYYGELEEGGAISAVLAVNTLIGFVTEWKAVRSIEALRALGTRTARVRREGRVRTISAEELVPGDVVVLEAGDAVSADLRLIETSGLSTDESSLTGESVAVGKDSKAVSADTRLGDRASMVFKGTAITRGTGAGVVVATGIATELGRVTRLVLEADPGSSPLERKLQRLSVQLVWATIAVAAIIAAVGFSSGKDPLPMIEAAIALAVAAIPEGLPIVATLVLARGMLRMARQKALIERLSAVETLGATTVILTDKTGTLTENRMTVRRLCTSSSEIELGTDASQAWGRARLAGDPLAAQLLRIAVLCNEAELDGSEQRGTGDPMEVALLRAGLSAGFGRTALLQGRGVLRKHAFDPAIKMMATVHEHEDGVLIAVKGAPEAVLAAATRVSVACGDVALDDAMRAEWLSRADRLGHEGLRVLACATKIDRVAAAAAYDRLVLVGLVGLEDPVRADVPPAIQACRQSGIRVVMVTGDHAVTAKSIAKAAGLGADVALVVEGKNIPQMIETGQPALRDVGIFARVNPDEKLALVRAYQAAGEIVAMTGDGVNDAPALRQADIGVAMGRRGTDVAREAAAMVLLDDAFPTIITAIREGRVIFANVRRFVAYLLSCNLSEVLAVGLAVSLALPLPLLPLQILYLNLITDVFPAFALAMGEGEKGILGRPPRDPQEPILGRRQWITIVLHGMALTAGTFGALAASFWCALDDRSAVTTTFLTLAFAQLWHTFDMRDPHSPFLVNEVTGNGWLWGALLICTALLVAPPYLPSTAHLLQLTPPTSGMWLIVISFSLAPLVVTQGGSAILRSITRARQR